MIDKYVKRVITPEPACQFWDTCGKQFCYNAVQNGQADVWLDDGLALHQFTQENSFCASLARIPEIKFLPFVSDVFVMMEHSKWAFVGNLSSAIAYENNKPDYLRLVNKYFMAHTQCAASFQHVQVSYSEMRGLFMTCLAITAFAVLYALARVFIRVRTDVAANKVNGEVVGVPTEEELNDRIAKVHTMLSKRITSTAWTKGAAF